MIKQFEIEGLILIETKIFRDARGYFFEAYNKKQFNEIVGKPINFVQDNVSLSKQHVVRGLHFQTPPHAQGKLVRVIKGSVIDVAVDIRKNSPTYGKHISVKLSEENQRMLWIPPGFAHGFVALENQTIFTYKCTDYYHPACERTLQWNDKDLNINWTINQPIISEKDQKSESFNTFTTPFEL
jgi:dTDP-4-dehydrorhamnose 3,5-epimerase